jgi:hypothetical protein
LVRLTVEEDFSATARTNLDNDHPFKQWFCIHRQSEPITKPVSGTYVLYVEDHTEESHFFQAKRHLSATNDAFHSQVVASQ